MKNFGDLQAGDILFRLCKGGDKIEVFKVRNIIENKVEVRIQYILNSEEFVWLFDAPKKESTCFDGIFGYLFFSCKEAVQAYLSQITEEENERHARELKTLQDLREQCESVRM